MPRPEWHEVRGISVIDASRWLSGFYRGPLAARISLHDIVMSKIKVFIREMRQDRGRFSVSRESLDENRAWLRCGHPAEGGD